MIRPLLALLATPLLLAAHAAPADPLSETTRLLRAHALPVPTSALAAKRRVQALEALLAATQAELRQAHAFAATPSALPRPRIPPPAPQRFTGLLSPIPRAAPIAQGTTLTYRAPGARVRAACGGRALFAGPFRSYGQLLIVDCGGGAKLVLGGLASLSVSPGARLAPGQGVGVAGPALTLELRFGEAAVDPRPHLR